ncbi:MAG: alpha-glucosidase C-terminal domain-containing protein, partial [Chloroflexi bacterium]|nr:alpha-glucosidase C-terminal domain-containing protein [Chloroflexota bacterium]
LLEGQYSPQHVNVAAQTADPDSLLRAMQRMIAARKQIHAFGWGGFEWLDAGTDSIAAYPRRYKNETLLIINNLSDQKQTVHVPFEEAADILSHENVSLPSLTLRPFQYLWLLIKK